VLLAVEFWVVQTLSYSTTPSRLVEARLRLTSAMGCLGVGAA
jgi:hypothetical protein